MADIAPARNFFNSIGIAADVQGNSTEELNLAIDLKYIRYFIVNTASHLVVFYGDYTLHGVSSMAELAAQLDAILTKDVFLNKAYKQVKVCWNSDFEIVPTPYFDIADVEAETAINPILNGEAKFLFKKSNTVSQLLSQKFGTVVDYHIGASMIEHIRSLTSTSSSTLYVNVSAEKMEVLYFDEMPSLRLYNRYEYRAYQDYIYYLLLAAEECKIDLEKTNVVLMGEVSQDSKLYEMTHRYFNSVSFIAAPSSIQFTVAFNEYPKHLNYLLYNL